MRSMQLLATTACCLVVSGFEGFEVKQGGLQQIGDGPESGAMLQVAKQFATNKKFAGLMRFDDDGNADVGCATSTIVAGIICPALKTLCANGLFKSTNITATDLAAALQAVGDDGSINGAISVPTIDITFPTFKDTKSIPSAAMHWAYGVVDPISRDFNQSKFDILVSFANKDGRIGLDELAQAEKTMFAEYTKDVAAGKFHGINSKSGFVPSFGLALYLEIFGTPDPETELNSVKVTDLSAAYSSGKFPVNFEPTSSSMGGPTVQNAMKFLMAGPGFVPSDLR